MEDVQASTNSSREDAQHRKAQEFKHSGNDKFNNNNYKGAIVEYKKGLLHEPNNPDLHANLSAAYIHLEKYLDAEEHAVYAIHLRPDFYKGYIRAAKAAHGKGMTTLALKRLNKGLTQVTDPNGIRDLHRLKNQYTAYLSLKSNAEREIDFSSEKYLSEEENEPYSADDDDDFAHDFQHLCPHGTPLQENCTLCPRENFSITSKSAAVVVLSDKSSTKITESSKTKPLQTQAIVEPETSCSKNAQRSLEHSEEEEEDFYVDSPALQKYTENDMALITKNKLQEKQPDTFLEMCKELTKDPKLKMHIAEFKDHLKTGSEAFLGGNFRKAAESYKAAKERDFEIDDRQYHVIKYVYCAALVNLGSYEDVIKAIQTLLEMETYKFSIPALYVQLARAYCKLNRFKTALEPLEKLQDILDNCPIFPTFTWPGTSETIQETTPTGLKEAVKELNQTCRMSHKPTAVCRYDHCLRTTTHILPSELIHISDPDFIGFVRMVCEEKCHIEFHITCWKSYKESISGIGKINDKDFLGQRCLTTDCVNSDGKPSVITVIEIIGADGQIKSVNKLDPKTNVDSKKSKKKRCKLDDKEKVVKLKKMKEKKVREVKKPSLVAEEEDEVAESIRNCNNPVNVLQSRIQSLKELRDINFGVEKSWDPKAAFYGRSDEMEKWVDKCENESSSVQYLDYSVESVDIKDAKEFIFSYFMEILKAEEGPLKQTEVEELWKQVAEDFCNIRVVLPNLKSMCELLLESTCFCQLEDYICLAGQLDAAYQTVKTEVVETVVFLMTGSIGQTSIATVQSQLPDLLHHPQSLASTNQLASHVSSEDESSESQDEYISGPDSEESEEESSEEDVENVHTPEVKVFQAQTNTPVEEKFTAPIIEPLDKEKFSLQTMLDEMDRLRNVFIKGTLDESTKTDKIDIQTNQETTESPNNDTFETAHESLQNLSDEDKDVLESSSDEQENKIDQSVETNKLEINPTTAVSEVLDQANSTSEIIEKDQNKLINLAEIVPGDGKVLTSNSECDKASQSGVSTKEQHMQTIHLETKNTLSQTKECDEYKEWNERVQELTKQLNDLSEENTRLSKEVVDKENCNKEIKKSQEKIIASLQDKNNKAIAAMKDQNKKLQEEISKKDFEFKQSEENMMKEILNIKETSLKLVLDKQKLKKEVDSLLEEKKEWNLKRDYLKGKILKSQQTQLLTTKAFWESQVNQLGKRCVEKISEMHSWFSLLPPGEVEELPSWKDVRQTTLQWGEISNKIQQIQTEFQIKYNEIESRLNRGEEVEDLCSLILPKLPDDPNPLPLDKIHKEITHKYTEKITELTQLVASQRLELEKSTSQQLQHQMVPRMQNPMTTAFGSLALQYSFPSTLGSSSIPAIPPNQDISKIGNITKPLQADVQTLLQESSVAKFNESPEKSSGKDVNVILPFANTSFLSMPPPSMGPPPALSGVTQSLLKSTSALAEKKDKKQQLPLEQQTHPKPEAAKTGSSRESTPIPVTPTPTPEKTRKKKKSKSDTRDGGEVKPPSMEEDTDTNPWIVNVHKKNLPKPVPLPVFPVSDSSKLKNTKRLLDKLQLKFPTTPLRELDDIVKLVREQNNGYLSGLPFDEIETRVERLITKRHYQKSTTMGLVKFSNAAWVPVKQQETITWTNLQLEECTICLEPMGQDRTKVDCNHEFHTKCLRKWLKEKRVCPLCNKFTTMADEFPAL